MPDRESKIIENASDIEDGAEALAAQCSVMAKAYSVTGAPATRLREAGAEGLLRIVAGQQLSVASAAAIWGRFEEVVAGRDIVAVVNEMTDEELRSCGLSRPKVRTIRAVCEAVNNGVLDLEVLGQYSIEDVHKALTPIHGIGPWTADIYSMFCLGHADAWAPGDLALQYAVQDLFSLDERPDGKAMLQYGERWRPWRGVAARILWAYYSAMKDNRTSIPV